MLYTISTVFNGTCTSNRKELAMWPFTRRRSAKQPPAIGIRVSLAEDGAPNTIPIYDTEYEPIVVALLERAAEASLGKESGEEFTVSLSDEEWDAVEFPALLTLPVFARAEKYGLIPEVAFDEKFVFSKL